MYIIIRILQSFSLKICVTEKSILNVRHSTDYIICIFSRSFFLFTYFVYIYLVRICRIKRCKNVIEYNTSSSESQVFSKKARKTTLTKVSMFNCLYVPRQISSFKIYLIRTFLHLFHKRIYIIVYTLCIYVYICIVIYISV